MTATLITDPAQVRRLYRYWQVRTLVGTILGYALFYFVRKKLSVAMPAMEQSLGIGKAQVQAAEKPGGYRLLGDALTSFQKAIEYDGHNDDRNRWFRHDLSSWLTSYAADSGRRGRSSPFS